MGYCPIIADKKILITRPKSKGLVFFEKLCGAIPSLEMGNFLFDPMVEIKRLYIELPNLDVYDAVIVTSSYAREILPKDYSCYSVGDDAPTAMDLADKIIRDNKGKKLNLLYIRGVDVAFDIKGRLEKANHNVDELISYEAVASTKLSRNVIDAIIKGDIFAVYFFSKRTAHIFTKLVEEAGILNHIQGVQAWCISDSVAKSLHSVFGENIKVSKTPDVDGMILMIK